MHDEFLLCCVVECLIGEDLLVECLAKNDEEVDVEFSGEQSLVVTFFDQTDVCVPLHAVGAVAFNELLKLLLIAGGLQRFSLRDGQRLSHDQFIVAQPFSWYRCQMLQAIDSSAMVELHVLLRLIDVDGTWLDGHQICAQNHLTETTIVHLLQTRLFLRTVYVHSLVLFVNCLNQI